MRKAVEIDAGDELPEADRLEGFAHPRETPTMFGQRRAEELFLDTYASGRLHHAWLLTGPSGIGKATFAYKCARFLLSNAEEKIDPETTLEIVRGSLTERQVAMLSHPRLLVIRRPYDTKAKRFATSIPVDEIRRLKSFVGRSAAGDEWRVVLVDTVNELNISAANALLKSLEEPPRQTVFLLVAPEPGRLLATIRSRCRTIALAPLERDDLRRALVQAYEFVEDEDERAAPASGKTADDDVLRAAGGSVRRALSLLAHGGSEIERRLLGLFEALPEVDWGDIQSLADQVSKAGDEQRYELTFDLLLEKISSLVKAELSADSAAEDRRLAERLIAPGRLASWANLWERVAREKAEADALNLDRKALIVRVISELARTAATASETGRRGSPP